MKTLMIALPLMAVVLSSCDKAKEAVEAAREKISGVKDPGAPVAPGGEVSADLAALVDNAAEGVRFRRDLAFPTHLKVRQIERFTFHNTRILSTSELGKQVGFSEGTWEEVGVIERDGGRLTLVIEKRGKVVDVEDVAKKAAKETPANEPSPQVASNAVGARIEFRLGPKGWRVPESEGPADFGSMVLEQSLGPALPVIIATSGLAPRSQWFSSSKRWLGGDSIVLSGDSIALLFPGEENKGKVTLTYEAAEALEGHPCGRFSVSGDVSEKNAVGIDGVKANSEITINSGKIWCSLIYPLVLREEYQTVMTSEEGSANGPKLRIQGGVDMVVSRAWEPVENRAQASAANP